MRATSRDESSSALARFCCIDVCLFAQSTKTFPSLEQGDRLLRGCAPRARPRPRPERTQHHSDGSRRGDEQEGEGLWADTAQAGTNAARTSYFNFFRWGRWCRISFGDVFALMIQCPRLFFFTFFALS